MLYLHLAVLQTQIRQLVNQELTHATGIQQHQMDQLQRAVLLILVQLNRQAHHVNLYLVSIYQHTVFAFYQEQLVHQEIQQVYHQLLALVVRRKLIHGIHQQVLANHV